MILSYTAAIMKQIVHDRVRQVHLVGFCFGGAVAYEVARKLEDLSIAEVLGVVIMDVQLSVVDTDPFPHDIDMVRSLVTNHGTPHHHHHPLNIHICLCRGNFRSHCIYQL